MRLSLNSSHLLLHAVLIICMINASQGCVSSVVLPGKYFILVRIFSAWRIRLSCGRYNFQCINPSSVDAEALWLNAVLRATKACWRNPSTSSFLCGMNSLAHYQEHLELGSSYYYSWISKGLARLTRLEIHLWDKHCHTFTSRCKIGISHMFITCESKCSSVIHVKDEVRLFRIA